MAWTTPLTAVANSAFTAAQFNASVRDNLNETAPGKATAAGRIFVSTGANAVAERVIDANGVDASQSTSSSTFTDLATTGPSRTITTGVRALVFIAAQMDADTIGSYANMSYAVTGASAISAGSQRAVFYRAPIANYGMRAGITFLETGLTAGSNIFTAKYAVVGGGNATFGYRQMQVAGL